MAKLNKFQKSVEQRRNIQETPVEVIPPASQPALKKTDETILTKTSVDQFLQDSFSRKAKNKTFYLDERLIELIKQISKEKGVSESKLVNDLLLGLLSEG